jgi:DNA-binding response OmpR family regulator
VVDPGLLPVLIVEDEAETRFIYEKLLTGSAYQAICARDLREARELLPRVRPHAIVLDLLLRGEEAWSWLVELKRDQTRASVPIIVATTVEDERKGLALGADAYCIKPLSRHTLLSKLDELTRRRVLVIDDDPASRYLLTRLLSDGHTSIIEAEDGGSGLEVARRARPSAIFLDLHLPDGNGEEVLGELRNDEQLNAIPVAIVTSRTLTLEERTRLGKHAQLVLQKNELSAAATREFLARGGL